MLYVDMLQTRAVQAHARLFSILVDQHTAQWQTITALVETDTSRYRLVRVSECTEYTTHRRKQTLP